MFLGREEVDSGSMRRNLDDEKAAISPADKLRSTNVV